MGKNHSGGNTLADSVQLKYIFPRLVSTCREYVFQCSRCQRLAKKTSQRHTYGHDLVGSPGGKICLDFRGTFETHQEGAHFSTNHRRCIYTVVLRLASQESKG